MRRGWAWSSSKKPVVGLAEVSDDEAERSPNGENAECCPDKETPGSIVVTETEGMGVVCTADETVGWTGVIVTVGIGGVCTMDVTVG
jgi:hypothetical protein